MKKLTFLILAFIVNQGFAQIWCRPGATWHYTLNTFYGSMYVKHTYVKDTLLLSQNCNKITYYKQGMTTIGPISGFGGTIYTYTNNNVVYILDQTINSFDTLFNFGGSIGDSWLLAPKSVSNCAKSKVNILDTGHYFIQSQKLKWIYVQVNAYTSWNSYSFNDTIIERIGSRNKYFYARLDLCPTGADQEIGGPLRCYDDDQIIGYKFNYPNSCTFFPTKVDEMSVLTASSIYPNPASNFIYLDVPIGILNSEIEIINSLGNVVANYPVTTKKINIEKLSSGYYFIKIKAQDYIPFYMKFIKE